MSDQNRRKLGADMEKLAADRLREEGYRIIKTNYYCHAGEIDIIGEEEGYLCFIEVKFRKDAAAGFPEEAVDFRKASRITKAAITFMNMCGYPEDTPCRFDVVAILGDRAEIIRNAFDAVM